MKKHGPIVYVGFYKINRPYLQLYCDPVVWWWTACDIEEVSVQSCNTEINVQNNIVFGCPIDRISSQTLNVQINQSVGVRAEYISPYTSGNLSLSGIATKWYERLPINNLHNKSVFFLCRSLLHNISLIYSSCYWFVFFLQKINILLDEKRGCFK